MFECYFSPTDNVNATIVNKIKTAESDIEGAVMLITRKEMAYAITDLAKAGVTASMLVNSKEDCAPTSGTPPVADYAIVNAFASSLGAGFKDYTGGGVMHNKYLIVDQSNTASDPMVLTGSHNWSASANNYNDENSVVIHDAAIANIYYQNFNKIAKSSNVITDLRPAAGNAIDGFKLYPNPASGKVSIEMNAANAKVYSLKVFDLTGRIVMNRNLKVVAGRNFEKIDISALPKGIYMVQTTGIAGSEIQKLIVK